MNSSENVSASPANTVYVVGSVCVCVGAVEVVGKLTLLVPPAVLIVTALPITPLDHALAAVSVADLRTLVQVQVMPVSVGPTVSVLPTSGVTLPVQLSEEV